MKVGLALAMVALLVGCGDSNKIDPQFLGEHTPQWQKLTDGSSYARLVVRDGQGELAIRCWPGDAAGFKCLRASRSDDIAGAVTITLADAAELPTFELGLAEPWDGYSCGNVLGQFETISRGGKDLIRNEGKDGQARWGEAFVERYMKDNGVGGTPYWGCLEVEEAVSHGSLETVSTTSITKAIIH